MMKAFSILAVTLFAGLAHAEYECTARAAGRSFSAEANNQMNARREAIRECLRATPARWDGQCDNNVNCRFEPNRPNRRPGTCFVAQNGRWMAANDFWRFARNYADDRNRCVVASHLGGNQRIFNDDGDRVTWIRGGTRQCVRLTCVRLPFAAE